MPDSLTADNANDPGPAGARFLADAFHRYNTEFRQLTRRASQRFDSRDWRGSQLDAVERIDLYGHHVDASVAGLRDTLAARALDRDLWREIRTLFAAEIAALSDKEFAKTFFSSVTRRLFATVGVAPDIEFVATDLNPLADIHSSVGTTEYLNEQGGWSTFKQEDEGTEAKNAGIFLPRESIEAIAIAIQEFQGHTSHADTEAKVLREWLAVEQRRVDAALVRP